MAGLGKRIKGHLVTVSMLAMLVLIVLSTVFTWHNKNRIVETTLLKEQAEEVKSRMGDIFREYLRGMDLGLRGYALTKSIQVLSPYENAVRGINLNLKKLDSLFKVQKLDTSMAKFQAVKASIQDYLQVTNSMKMAVERDSINQFLRILKQDKGYDVWKLFSPFNDGIIRFEDKIIAKANADYESALDWNIFIQLILLALGIPSIFFIIFSTARDARNNHDLLVELEKNNRQYLFDPGNEIDARVISLPETIGQSIANFKKANEFIQGMSSQNFNVQWEGLDESNKKKNEDTLAGELIKMRDQMKTAKQETDDRFWVNDGLAQFSQLVRNHQANLKTLCDESTRFLSRYLKVQMGSLYIINDENPNDVFLEMAGFFAAENKKETDSRIEIGNGLVGQAYVNGEPIVLTNIPSDYVEISSGLGSSKPKGVCIVPLKYNEKIEAVLELASFHSFEPYKIAFLQKAGEFVASAIISAKVSAKMKIMLNESQQQTEEMRSQEEEMRQNMEELTAIQEEIERQGKDSKGMMNTLIGVLNELPQKIFLKDEAGKILLANNQVAKAHNLSIDELIGKSDYDFVDAKTAKEWSDQEKAILKKGRETYTFDETLNGQTKTLTTTKLAFFIPHLNKTGLLGIQTDVTELENLKHNKKTS